MRLLESEGGKAEQGRYKGIQRGGGQGGMEAGDVGEE